MLAEFIPDFRNRQRRDLLLHEALHAADAVFQRVIDGVVEARSHRKKGGDAECGDAAGEDH